MATSISGTSGITSGNVSPGIIDNSNANAITIDSAEKATFAGAVDITGAVGITGATTLSSAVHLAAGSTTDIKTITYAATITPSLADPWLQKCALTGNITINEPTDGTYGGCVILLTIDASLRTVTAGTGVTAIGILPDLDASGTFEARLIKHSNTLTTLQVSKVGV